VFAFFSAASILSAYNIFFKEERARILKRSQPRRMRESASKDERREKDERRRRRMKS
jgi:hypothetical protein